MFMIIFTETYLRFYGFACGKARKVNFGCLCSGLTFQFRCLTVGPLAETLGSSQVGSKEVVLVNNLALNTRGARCY